MFCSARLLIFLLTFKGPSSITCSLFCKTGYYWDSSTLKCKDRNECSSPSKNNCDQLATCTNTKGSYTCTCNSGYTGSGKTCSDLDECETGADSCSVDAVCSNIIGSHNCACKPEYTGDGFVCKLIYEIEIRHDPHGKILATELNDAVNTTCLKLKHPSLMNSVVMKIDMTLWPEEGTDTFYIKIRHGKVPLNYKQWLAVYITIGGVQRKYTEPPMAGTTVMKVCTYAADHSDGVATTVMKCVCLQECSVIFHFKLEAAKSIKVCEIEVLREPDN